VGASEADSNDVVTPAFAFDVIQVLETGTVDAVSFTSGTFIDIVAVVETNTIYAVTPVKAVDLGSASETGTAGTVSEDLSTVDVGAVTETDTIAAITVARATDIGAVTSSEAANATLAPLRAADIAAAQTENDFITPVELAWAVGLGAIIEQDTTSAITWAWTVDIGVAIETDIGRPATLTVTAVNIGAVTENDIVAAVNLGQGQLYDLGSASETDLISGVIVGIAQTIDIGAITETDTVTGIESAKLVIIGKADSEVGYLLGSIVVTHAVDITTAGTETSIAQGSTGVRSIDVAPANELEQITALDVGWTVNLPQIVETDLVRPMTIGRPLFIDIGAVLELDLVGGVERLSPRVAFAFEGVWMSWPSAVVAPSMTATVELGDMVCAYLFDVLAPVVLEDDTFEVVAPTREGILVVERGNI